MNGVEGKFKGRSLQQNREGMSAMLSLCVWRLRTSFFQVSEF